MGTIAVVMGLVSIFIFYVYRTQIRKAANSSTGVLMGRRIFEQETGITRTDGPVDEVAFRTY